MIIISSSESKSWIILWVQELSTYLKVLMKKFVHWIISFFTFAHFVGRNQRKKRCLSHPFECGSTQIIILLIFARRGRKTIVELKAALPETRTMFNTSLHPTLKDSVFEWIISYWKNDTWRLNTIHYYHQWNYAVHRSTRVDFCQRWAHEHQSIYHWLGEKGILPVPQPFRFPE